MMPALASKAMLVTFAIMTTKSSSNNTIFGRCRALTVAGLFHLLWAEIWTLVLLLQQLPAQRASRWPDKENMNYNQRGRLQVEKPRPDDVLAVAQPWYITSKNSAEAQHQRVGFLRLSESRLLSKRQHSNNGEKNGNYITDEHLEGGNIKGRIKLMWAIFSVCVRFF